VKNLLDEISDDVPVTYMDRELTGCRPSNYSVWHRVAFRGRGCYMTDGDWFEQRYRNGKFSSVAYIETIQTPEVENAAKKRPLWSSKKALCLEIEEKMKIPAFAVWHNAECSDFFVMRVSEKTHKRMNEQEYKEFIRNL
jgi:hypothetical protein